MYVHAVSIVADHSMASRVLTRESLQVRSVACVSPLMCRSQAQSSVAVVQGGCSQQ
jgi:hypothetical protein